MDTDTLIETDQRDIAAFLSDPQTHGGVPVERIDTYGAMVFLAGDTAYKVKRAVAYPWMDFSTLAACRAELALNRRTAPQLYRAVAAITRAADGRLALDGEGEPVEWAVVMRRFDQDTLFDRLAAQDGLSEAHIRDAVAATVALHDGAEIVRAPADAPGSMAAFTGTIREIADEFDATPELFAETDRTALREAMLAALNGVAPLLERRRADGFVRRVHGDLHLANICLVDGRATLFDCIEFNDAIACIDTFYDIAFLLMDLEHRGLRRLANVALNAYLAAAPGGVAAALEALAALPLMLALRAGIRAMVSAKGMAAQDDAGERDALAAAAGRYFAAAQRFLQPQPFGLLAIGGLSGSGKSTLARALAPDIGRAPGAVHLRSDAIRKELCGVAETEKLPETAYTRAVSNRVYAEMYARARLALAAGQSVIVDGVNADAEGRADLRRLADQAEAGFAGLWLEAPPETLKARVSARRGDASDADAAVVELQLGAETGPIDWLRLDAGAGAAAVLAQARRMLGADGETG